MMILKKCSAVLLAMALVLTTAACGSQPTSPASEGTPAAPAAMGRYIEEELTFPEGLENIAQTRRVKDGSILLLASKTADMVVGPWYIYSSTDDGVTWTQKDTPWLSKLDDATITGSDFTPDGGLVLAYVIYTDEMHAAMDAAMAAMDYDAILAIQPTYHYVSIDATGVFTEFFVELPDANDGRAGSPAELGVADNGDIVINDYYTLYQFDGTTHQLKNKYQPSQQPRTFLLCGDQLALVDNSEILIFDLASGEKTETITLPADDLNGRLAWDGEALYYAGTTGIYRHVPGGAVLEQVVNGALTSLNMPALSCVSIFPCSDKSFLGLFSDADGYSTLRYRYSQETPTVPETQLRVYSLREDKNIRQAMGLYQRKHPDTQVVFDVGIPSGSTVLVSDALRTLSTQLLAGKGPDILVLDGMPIDSYIEKKVLLELSADITDGLLPNIVAASREADGKLYALPARFQVPMALSSSAAEEMTTLTALADYQSAQIKSMPKLPDNMGNPMMPTPSSLITTFYPVCAPAWEKPDGTVDAAAVSAFLTDLKKITDAQGMESWQGIPPTTAFDGSVFDIAFSAAYWLFGHIPMVYGHSFEFFNLAPMEEAISQKGDGEVILLPGQTSNVFIPNTMLGINAATKAPAAAEEFLATVLSQQVQFCEFPGYPVNTAAFDQSAINPFSAIDDGYTYGTMEADGSNRYLQVIWPDVPYMEQMKTMLKSLDQSSRVDVIAEQMVIDETVQYFYGNEPLDTTVVALTEKLRLYLSE